MASFWAGVFEGHSIILLILIATFNAAILFYLVHWGSVKEKEGNEAINKTEEFQKALDDLTRRCENKELDLLIKPIYLAFDKYPDDPNILTREKFGLSMLWSLMSHPSEKSQKFLRIEKADTVIDVFQQHGNLAQPELRELIRQYLEFRGRHEEKRISCRDEYFINTATTVGQIESLVKERYTELMWGKEGD